MGAFLTYALDEDGALVHVDDVAKGAKCACHCPHCDAPLYAKNAGTRREHHFAHAHGHECEGAYESSLHLLAKEILQETGRIMLPKSNGSHFPTGSVRTADQAKVMGIFKQLTTQWKSLSNAQILAWNKLALSQEGRSVLGTKAKISGSNLFTRLNYWIVACGGTATVNPPALVGVENPGAATIACSGETFTFKVASVPADVTNLKLVIEASEGQSNGVTRAHGKAVQIKLVDSPSTSDVDIRSDYVAKHGAPSAAAPKIFFRYYLVNAATGEKSGTMLAETTWSAGE